MRPTETDLRGRHVVITGGRGGLGGAVVAAFVERGAICHLPQRSASVAAPVAADVHVTSGVDLTDEAAVSAYYRSLPPLWASIHLAGGWAGAPLVDTSLALLRQQLDINLVTAFLCSREAVKAMKEGGGRIVNVASRAALVPGGGALAYAAAKAGVVALTQGLAAEVRNLRILVNAIAPGTIDTAANRDAMPAANPAGWALPVDIAAAVVWLASPDNVLVTGSVLPVEGSM